MITRRGALALGLAIAPATALGCTPQPNPTPSPAPSRSESKTATLTRDFTAPGQARAVIEEMIAAAGTIQAIKVELEKTEASMSVVSGMEARTYAWRDGRVVKVDSDTRYVGQAIFDPRDFRIDDLGSLFATAAALSKSGAPQQLQIVEYADRTVLITVTTNPESLTVFFRKDGSLIAPVDLSTAGGLASAIREVVGTKRSVLALGVLPNNGGCFVDTTAGDGVIVRTVRMARLPVRTAARREPTSLQAWDPALVHPSIVIDVLTRTMSTNGASTAPWSLVIDRRGGVAVPQMHFTIGGTEMVTTLEGVDITPR